MLLAHHPEALDALRTPTEDDPLRVLVSGCLAAWSCGVDGTDYGLGEALRDLFALPTLRVVPFCPEQHALGTPRTMPDVHDGDGVDVLAGRARILDEHGEDLTTKMIEGGRAMLAEARANDVELAILTDSSAACGSQIIYLGGRLTETPRRQKGVGVATAILLEAGIPVLAQRDHASIARLREKLDPGYTAQEGLADHHEHPWTLEHFPGPHPRA